MEKSHVGNTASAEESELTEHSEDDLGVILPSEQIESRIGTSQDESDLEGATSALAATEPSFDKEFNSCIETFYQTDKNNHKIKYVRCKLCVSLPNIVKLNSDNNKMAPLTTSAGCRYRQRYVSDHFQTKYHEACKMAINVSSDTKGSIEFYIGEADEKMATHVSKLLFDVYVDAKKLTCSAHSWPARFVGAEAGRSFKYNDKDAPTVSPSLNLQYVNKPSHLDFLTTIVQSDQEDFQEKVTNAIACSIRMDGSVDRSQLDKIYIMLVIITARGKKELTFLGIAEQTERKAAGLFEAIKRGMVDNLGDETYLVVMKNISSICTDGTNMNIGEKNSLWALFEKELRRINSTLPLTKVWCSSHRMELVWKDVSRTHTIIGKALTQISDISSHFRTSGQRTNALKRISKEKNLRLMTLPKLFTVRWTEFSYTIINNLLLSWHVLMLYLAANKEANATESGYFKFLSKLENLKVTTFLADLLQIYSRHHKKTQDKSLTIVSLTQSNRSLRSALTNLRDQRLVGGWEETLNNQIVNMNGQIILKGFELINTSEKRRASKNDFNSVRKAIIDSIISRLDGRFASDDALMTTIEPFVNFNKNADIRKVHELLATDLDLSSLQLQFNEIVDQNTNAKLNGDAEKMIQTLAANENYKEIVTTMSRIHACTPHSADVERCISANNMIKTPLRNSISIETENKYLFVYFNMPVLEKWNAKKALKLWMNEKQRKDYSNVIERKAKNASHFKGIFEVAHEDEQSKSDDSKEIKSKSF